MKNYKIRPMTRNELKITVSWAAKEGWNPGLNDAEVFWQTDPEGFVVLEKTDEMIGSGSIISYNGNFGFMGFFIIKPEYRGKGLGTKLWYYRRDRLLKRLKKNATIGMDGVFNMQDFYANGGFKFSHRDLRMQATASKQNYDKYVQEIFKSDFEEINNFDKICFGFERKKFLKAWLNMNDSKVFKYVKNSKVSGFGVIRKCVKGYKIGPLFATDFGVADELFKAFSSYAAGKQVFIDIPEINKNALKLAKKYQMKECFGCAKMFYGTPPKLPYNKIYGVTTFELG